MGSDGTSGSLLGYAARGTLGAMAMTGMRRVTKGLGLLQGSPPELVAKEGLPRLLRRVPPGFREEAIELAHWSFGAGAAVGFGVLPRSLRRRRWAGAAFGLAVWAGFDAVVAPMLGLSKDDEWRPSDRLAVLADHVLYGVVVGSGR